MSDSISIGRYVLVVVVLTGLFFGITNFVMHHSGVGKAMTAVQQAATERGLPASDISCTKSTVAPASIAYVARVVLPRASGVTLYDCRSLKSTTTGGEQQWCVVGTSGSNPWFAQIEDCATWSQSPS